MPDEIILKKGGDRVCVRIGNTVIDIQHGYNHSEKEPCALIDLYPYESEKQNRLLVREYIDGKVKSLLCR